MPKPLAEKDQKQRFIDTARELGADEDEKAFADKLRRIAKPPRGAGKNDGPAKPK